MKEHCSDGGDKGEPTCKDKCAAKAKKEASENCKKGDKESLTFF